MSDDETPQKSGMVQLVDHVFALTLIKELDRLFTALFGMGADALVERRAQRVLKIQAQREKKAAQLGASGSKALPEKVAQEVVNGASVEDDEDIQELWSNLLANHDAGMEINAFLVRLLKDLDSKAVRVLLHFWNKFTAHKPELDATTSQEQWLKVGRKFFVPDSELLQQVGPWGQDSRARLMGMGIVNFIPTPGSAEPYYVLSDIGETLCQAVTGPKIQP